MEGLLRTISRRKFVCAIIVFLFPVLLRLLLLPVYSPPVPFISDEYAYLLQADTFASGRLTNPAPPLPESFASVYVLASPTYTGEYQVGQGVALALGQVLTRSPWVGVMLSMGVMCALIYWALRAWLPAEWAFGGTLLVVDVELGVLSYWMNSYWGGCVAAIAGALALGGLVRLRDRSRVLYSFVTAAGLTLLFNSRPLEAVLLTMMTAGALTYWTFVSKELSLQALFGRVVPSLLLSLMLAAAFGGYYNQRVTGKATEFPYLLYRSEYGLPQGFFWQKAVLLDKKIPADIQSEYEDQLHQHERRRSLAGLVSATGGKLRRFWEFYIGIPLTVALVFLPSLKVGRGDPSGKMGLALWTLFGVLVLDNLTFFAYFPHYSAAVTVLITLVMIQLIRTMRARSEAGLFLSRALPVVCVLGLLIPMGGRWLEPILPAQAARARALWESEFLHEVSRERFVPQLEREPGKQLVLVRYQPYDGERKHEWIFNRANLQAAKIVWARDPQDEQTIRRLLKEFSPRKVWLAEPDATPPRVLPYQEAWSR